MNPIIFKSLNLPTIIFRKRTSDWSVGLACLRQGLPTEVLIGSLNCNATNRSFRLTCSAWGAISRLPLATQPSQAISCGKGISTKWGTKTFADDCTYLIPCRFKYGENKHLLSPGLSLCPQEFKQYYCWDSTLERAKGLRPRIHQLQ